MHRLAWNAGVGYKLRPLLSRRPPTPAPLAENARLLCMKWLWRGVVRGREAACNSRSSLRLARWQLQNVPVAPSSPTNCDYIRGCVNVDATRPCSREGEEDLEGATWWSIDACISIRFCIEISRYSYCSYCSFQPVCYETDYMWTGRIDPQLFRLISLFISRNHELTMYER